MSGGTSEVKCRRLCAPEMCMLCAVTDQPSRRLEVLDIRGGWDIVMCDGCADDLVHTILNPDEATP